MLLLGIQVRNERLGGFVDTAADLLEPALGHLGLVLVDYFIIPGVVFLVSNGIFHIFHVLRILGFANIIHDMVTILGLDDGDVTDCVAAECPVLKTGHILGVRSDVLVETAVLLGTVILGVLLGEGRERCLCVLAGLVLLEDFVSECLSGLVGADCLTSAAVSTGLDQNLTDGDRIRVVGGLSLGQEDNGVAGQSVGVGLGEDFLVTDLGALGKGPIGSLRSNIGTQAHSLRCSSRCRLHTGMRARRSWRPLP